MNKITFFSVVFCFVLVSVFAAPEKSYAWSFGYYSYSSQSGSYVTPFFDGVSPAAVSSFSPFLALASVPAVSSTVAVGPVVASVDSGYRGFGGSLSALPIDSSSFWNRLTALLVLDFLFKDYSPILNPAGPDLGSIFILDQLFR